MTVDGSELSTGKSDQRLQILLTDYQACREDERVQFATGAAVIGILVTLIGLMVAAVTQTCEFSSSKSCVAAPDYLLAASPMIPIALLGYSTYFMVVGTLRTYYMRGLENEMRTYVPAPIVSLGDIMPASYIGIVQEVTSLRRGHIAYRLIAYLMLLIVIVVFGGYTAYVAFHLAIAYQVGMSIAYSGIAILFVWQVAHASLGGRSFFERAARDFLNRRRGTVLPVVRGGTASSGPKDGRSLVAYLIFPRPEDWIKWLVAPGVFLAVGWSYGDLSRWSTFLELWLVLEYLIYAARYQWNDVRGIDEDSLHSERQARRRLPAGPAQRTRRNVLISLAVAIGRVVVAVVVGQALGLLRPVLVLLATVLSIAIIYEMLRSRRPSPEPTRPTPTVAAIWSIVGLGYGIRAGLGLIVGGLSAKSSLTWIGVSCFIVLGVMFVNLTWVLEAASCCYYEESDGQWWTKPGAVLKPHLLALLGYVPIKLEGQGNDAWTAEEDGSRHAILRKRGRMGTPWNAALMVSAALGGALGVGLAHATRGYLAESVAVSVSIAAAGVLAYRDSQQARLVVSGIAALVLVSVVAPFGHWPISLLSTGPWLTVALLYVIFRGSSYRDLKEFVPNLLRMISSVRIVLQLGPRLLHAVIGEGAWLAAGFGGSQELSNPDRAITVPRQIAPINGIRLGDSNPVSNVPPENIGQQNE